MVVTSESGPGWHTCVGGEGREGSVRVKRIGDWEQNDTLRWGD